MAQNRKHASSKRLLGTDSPAFWACVLGGIVGVCLVLFGARQMMTGTTPSTLNIALIILGIVELATSHYTLRKVRAAWSFALSLNGTACVALLFSGPRIRDAADVSIGVALLPCLVFGVLVLLHSLNTEEF